MRTPVGVYRGRCALIAEGAQGHLKGRARRRETRAEQGFAIVTEIPVTQPQAGIAEIHFGMSRWGYGWIFPHAGYLSVGVGGLLPAMPRIRERLQVFLRKNGLPETSRCRGHVIPMGGIRRNLVNGRILLQATPPGSPTSAARELPTQSGPVSWPPRRCIALPIEALEGYQGERALAVSCGRAFLARLVRFPAAFHRLFSSHPGW